MAIGIEKVVATRYVYRFVSHSPHKSEYNRPMPVDIAS